MRSTAADRPRVEETADSTIRPDEEPAAHTLTLEFGRYLTAEEWRTVVDQVKAHVPHVQHLRANVVPDAVHVGDKLRFSAGLLQQIHAEPEHRSRLVELERIVHEDDGSLLLHLKAVA